MNTRFFATQLLLGATFLAAQACSEDATTAPANALTEIQPDCLECMRTLAECTSTAKNEEQFVGCRDIFQTCENKMDLGPDECGRPSNKQACELCRDRLESCPEDDKTCDVGFSVCKTFLMTRDQDACTTQPAEVLGDCDTCVATLASCAFGGGDKSVCEASFYTCRNANKVTPASCPGPSVADTCEACTTQHTKCLATTTDGCEEGWAACVGVLSTDGACGDGPDGGTGGGGTGGGDPGPLCPHEACETGAAMDASCDSCIAGVCAIDDYCCTTEYDDYCVAEAATVPDCACGPVDTCVHDVCSAGDLLEDSCNDCAATVCDADGFCCNTEWDSLCIEHAVDLCGATCG